MEIGRFLVSWAWLVCIWSVAEAVKGLDPCNFPAKYNFGDSNSDTGGISAVYMPLPPPNGVPGFGKPSGRICDGRLIVDFMAEHLGMPYLHAYLDSIATNFRHGANFATGGSTIQTFNESYFQTRISPFPLVAQLWQFEQFKARTIELYNQVKENPSKTAYIPHPEDFSKALYTIDIAQNDLSAAFPSMSDEQIHALIPSLLNQYAFIVQKLYQQEARTFWIHNTGPIGCLPRTRFDSTWGADELDQYGCVKYQNDIASEFNRQLKERVNGWRTQFPDAAFTYVDIYRAKYQLISDAKNQGFVDPLQICCGHHQDMQHVGCGDRKIINGTEIYGAPCTNPSMYISWDGVHYTQAANHWVADHIINGALSDPPISLSQACHSHPGSGVNTSM